MLIPEVILYNSLYGLLGMITADWLAKNDKHTTILYDIFGIDDNDQQIKIDTYNYFDQAQAILLRNSTSPKKLEFFIGYNLQRVGIPTVHILMPSETKGKMDVIGDYHGQPSVVQGQEEILYKAKSTACSYHLMVTSDNSSEVLVIYYFLKAVIEMYIEHFELSGFKDMSFSGADINFQQDLIPNVFHRNLSLSFNYLSANKTRHPINDATGVTVELCEEIQDCFTPDHPYNG